MKNFYGACFSLICIISISSNLHAQESCLDFDGEDDFVNIPLLNMTGQEAFTVEAWIYIEDITLYSHEVVRQNGANIPAGYLLSVIDYSGSSTKEIHFGLHTANGYKQLFVTVFETSWLNQWKHIAGVYDGTQMKLYVGGVLVNSIPHSGTLLVSPTTHRIGVSVSGEHFNGLIDEVRLWDVARSTIEISTNKDCKLIGPVAGLLAVYNFDEGLDLAAKDASGNNYHGELINGPVWQEGTVALDCTITSSFESTLNSTVRLYPNPVSDRIYFESQINHQELIIRDAAGRVFLYVDSMESSIDVSNLASGIYQAQFIFSDKIITKRFVKN